MFDNYITIWKLFNEVCKGHKKAPRSEHWQGLTKLYNQDNQVLIKEELIRDWINNICIPAAKNYLKPMIFLKLHSDRRYPTKVSLGPSTYDIRFF